MLNLFKVRCILFARESVKIGLRISGSKTKIMHIGYACGQVPVNICRQWIEEVDLIIYLGSIISAFGDTDHEVVYRIGKATMVLRFLQPLWCTNTIVLETKVWLFNSIIPTAVYACETCKMMAKPMRRLNTSNNDAWDASWKSHIEIGWPIKKCITECQLAHWRKSWLSIGCTSPDMFSDSHQPGSHKWP